MPPTNEKTSPNVLVWVDIETTGLDAEKDVPLELGIKVTDTNLKVLHEKAWLVFEPGWRERLLGADSFVQEMHTKSNLKSELFDYSLNAEETPAQFISSRAVYWLVEVLELPTGEYPLCGSSVHFDRKFLQKYFPALHSFFSYRNIDVSTVKELCKRLRPKIYEKNILNNPRFDKANAKHRVLDDIDNSIEELKIYINHLFVPVVQPPKIEIFYGQQPLPGM